MQYRKPLIAGLLTAGIALGCGHKDARLPNGMTIPGQVITSIEREADQTIYHLEASYGAAVPQVVVPRDGKPFSYTRVVTGSDQMGFTAGHLRKRDLTYEYRGEILPIWQAPW